MYEPGHLHLTHVALQPTDISYDIHLSYEVNEDPKDGTCVHFTMKGEINGKPFEEQFQLTRDLAFNFAHDASRIAIRHGLPNSASLPIAQHKDYDRMFADIRDKLHVRSGEPVKPEHLE
ncbi:Acetyl-CoA carboxylase alpha subunit [Pseudomonas caricapapayae]|uniref:Uncharacterized protein n=1 Tax=Pseudomonas caricapapayae TaxID=46678 RepID=A0A0P9KC93_9PSED|nr:DUF5064 family protein [Pseudomonas caricapapayae]KAA8695842.1 DUF5064 family protein [Pseudomonas caricapapayae]KPW58803.1 Acetyl-CoA carboxylase alpha subunit [Pseudomonas caricapapayae]RMM08149.1 hypothetical protein ALQ84_00061 [Pseudomonas caricapapayae]